MDLALAQQMAEYIRVTQPQLDKAASFRGSMAAYRVKAAEAIDKMVNSGLVPMQSKVAMYNDLAANPERAADLLLHLIEKVASAPVTSLGGASNRPSDSGDPILGFVMANR